MVRSENMKIKKSTGESIFDFSNIIFLIFISIITLYPFIYVLFGSFSHPASLSSHRGLLMYPLNFNLDSYKFILKNPLIASGYMNTLIILVVGTAISLYLTSTVAYALSRKDLMFKNVITFIFVFTMFFGGGLIPLYLLILKIKLYNTIWAVILPSCVSVMNIVVMRTYFQGIPSSLEESAKLDGATDITILFKIIIPLALPVFAVMILFYGVGYWNSWFQASVFFRSREKYPLQLVLREILINGALTQNQATSLEDTNLVYHETMKYATIMIATGPIIVLYPFIQKYFVKGVMVGALKG
jgi:putative aldouronate transport system permease protein